MAVLYFCIFIFVSASPLPPHPSPLTPPSKLSLPSCHFQVVASKLSLPSCRFEVVASKLSLPSCRFQVVAFKLSLPCCRFQVVTSTWSQAKEEYGSHVDEVCVVLRSFSSLYVRLLCAHFLLFQIIVLQVR